VLYSARPFRKRVHFREQGALGTIETRDMRITSLRIRYHTRIARGERRDLVHGSGLLAVRTSGSFRSAFIERGSTARIKTCSDHVGTGFEKIIRATVSRSDEPTEAYRGDSEQRPTVLHACIDVHMQKRGERRKEGREESLCVHGTSRFISDH